MVLRRAIIANFLGQGWTALSGFIFIPVYIHLMGIESFGIIGFFTVIQASASLLDLGITPTISRQLSLFRARLLNGADALNLARGFQVVAILIALGLTAVLWLAAPFFARDWFGTSDIPQTDLLLAFQAIAVVVGLRFCESICRGALIGLNLQVRLNILLIMFATLRNGGVILPLIWLSPTISVFFFYQMIVSVIALLSFWIAARMAIPKIDGLKLSFSPLRTSLNFSAGMFGITATSLALTQLDKIILSRFVPLIEYSSYMLATSIAGALPLIVGPVTQAIYPRLVSLVSVDDEISLSDLYHRASQLVAVLVGPPLALALLFSHQAVFIWSGDHHVATDVSLILPIIVSGTCLNALFWLPYHAQLALGWTGLMVRYNAIAVVVFVPLNYVAASNFGGPGVAMTWLALNFSYVVILVPIVHQRFLRGESGRWYLADTLGPVAAAIAAIAIAWLAAPDISASRPTWIIFLTASYALGTLAALLAARRLSTSLLTEVKAWSAAI